MKPPLYVRPLTPVEYKQLTAALRSSNTFRVRRAQTVLASARGQSARPIAQFIGCSVQTVRNVIRAFNTAGVDGLAKQSNRPKSTQPFLDAVKCAQLRHLLHQPPRTFGKPTGLWTLALAAQVCYEQGLTAGPISDETVRRAIKRLGANWKRAKHWITSPDPQYARKKKRGIASYDSPRLTQPGC
jgi:transposase